MKKIIMLCVCSFVLLLSQVGVTYAASTKSDLCQNECHQKYIMGCAVNCNMGDRACVNDCTAKFNECSKKCEAALPK